VSKIQAVIATYDVLYTLGPFQKAICQKDNSGNYCAVNSTSSAAKRASLDRRDDTQQALAADVQQLCGTSTLFLGIQANDSANQLCTPCTRNIMNVYTTQLAGIPYSPSISSSCLLSAQATLYNAINSKCGASFLGGQVQAAGALAKGAASRSADSSFALVGSGISAIALGAMALL
jgi:hypothetical protein